MANWNVGSTAATAYPSTADDTASFGIAAMVDVDGDADIKIYNVSVTAAVTVTLNRSGNARLCFSKLNADAHGYSVATGSKLVINVPTYAAARFDLSSGGTIEWNSTFTRQLNNTYIAYFHCDRLDMGSGFLHTGNGSSNNEGYSTCFGMGQTVSKSPFEFNLLGTAKIDLSGMPFRMVAGSSWSYGVHFTQDGAETLVTNTIVSGKSSDFYIHYSTKETTLRSHWYKLKNGTINITGNLRAGHLPEGDKVGVGGDYFQEGGNATFHGQLMPQTGNIYLRGGTLTTDGGVKVPDGGTGSLQMEGGTLNLHGSVDAAFTVSGGVLKPSEVVINQPITMTGGTLVPGSGVTFGASGKIVLGDGVKYAITNDCTWAELQAALTAYEIGGDVVFTAEQPVTVTFPAGSTVADFVGDENVTVAVEAGATIPDGVTIRAGGVTSASTQVLANKVDVILVGGTHAYSSLEALSPKSVELDGANLTYTAADVINLPIKLTRTVFTADAGLQFGSYGKFIYNGGSVKVEGTQSYADLMNTLKVTMKSEGDKFKLVTDSAATLNITASTSLPEALEIASNVTISVAGDVQLTAATDTIPALTIRNGGKLRLRNQSSRIVTAIELTLDEGSELAVDAGQLVNTDDYARTMIVAHSFVLKGVTQGRGRYIASTTGEFRCYYSAAAGANFIYVPYTWTGEGDGKTLSDLDNWEDGAWADTDNTIICDFSAATASVELAANAMLGGIAYLPPTTRDGSTLSFVNATGGDYTLSLRGDTIKTRSTCRAGCTVDFAVNVKNHDGVTRSLFEGGGTWIFRRNLDQNGVDFYLSLAGAAEIAGTLTTASDFQFAEHYNSLGYLRFVEGANVELSGYLTLDQANGWSSGHGFRQTGGSVAAKGVVMTVAKRKGASVNNNNYVLEGGSLTLTEQLRLGGSHPLWPDVEVSMGGFFEMTGGTLTTPIINNEVNLNYCRLYGGDVYLGAGGFAKTTSAQASSYVQTEAPIVLGAVTLHAASASWSVDPALWITLTGAATFDVAQDLTVTIDCPVTNGVGGIVKQGAGALTVNGRYDATGDIRLTAGTLAFADNADLSLELVDVYDLTKLTLKSGTTLTVKKLRVNGVYQANGSYDLSSGRLVVAGPHVWTDETGDHKWNTAGNWHVGTVPTVADEALVPSGATAIELDGAAAVSNLLFEAGAVTFGGIGRLGFAPQAALQIPEATTVTFDSNTTVVVDWLLLKEGVGKVLVKGKLVNVLDPQTIVWPNPIGTNEFRVVAGEAEIRGDVCGLRVQPYSQVSSVMPRLTIGEGATFTNQCFVHGPWAGYDGTAYGEVVMNGGYVNVNFGIRAFSFWGYDPAGGKESTYKGDKYGFCFFKVGHGSFTLNGGTFIGPANGDYSDVCFNLRNTNPGGGQSELTINGGEMSIKNCLHFGLQNDEVDTLTLNGGKLSFGKLSAGSGTGRKIVQLNGGELCALGRTGTKVVEGEVICGIDEDCWVDDGAGGRVKRGASFESITVGGEVRFTQASTSVECEIGPKLVFSYDNAKLINGGPGMLWLRYAPEGDIAVELGRPATIKLGFDGVKEVESVKRGTLVKPAGDYGVGGLYPQLFPGGGIFRAKTGEPEKGLVIFLQ